MCVSCSQRGWRAVNKAYESPPTSTAEILYPSWRREGLEPATPRPPGPLPDPWILRREQSFGAFDLVLLFSSAQPRQVIGVLDAGRIEAKE